MTDLSMTAPAANPYLRAGAAALAVLATTSIHHVYGAIVYDTPWRLHIVHIAAPAAVVIVAALYLGATRQGTAAGRVAAWAGIAVILAFCVALIGVFEGGYNHVVKNVAYLAAGESGMRALFPEWLYGSGSVETPGDLVFEATGIVQFPLSVLAAVLALRLARRVS